MRLRRSRKKERTKISQTSARKAKGKENFGKEAEGRSSKR